MNNEYRIGCHMYNWAFDESSPVSAYEQLADYFRKLISEGVLLHGQVLRSQRDYCDIFGVSRPTVNKAFELLERERLIRIEAKKRAVVTLTDDPALHPPLDWQMFTGKSRYSLQHDKYKQLNYMRGSSNIINLYECYFGRDFDPHIPVKKAMELAQRHMTYHHTSLDVRGTLPLRQAICNHVAERGIHAEPAQVLVCNTLQNAYNIVFDAFCNDYTNCYLEEESLFLADKYINGIALPMDGGGILPSALLENVRSKQRGFLVIDTQYNMPRGVTYTKERRREIAKIAAANRLPVVESEVVRDCWHTTPPAPPVKAFDMNGNVVYIFSFARPFMTMLTTAIIAPEPLMPVLMDIKLQSDEYSDLITQTVAEKLLSRGLYSEYMDSIRPRIMERRDKTDALLRKYFNGMAKWNDGVDGVNFRVGFDFDISKIFPILEKRGVMLYSPEMFSSKHNFIWFCYTGADLDTLDHALGKIYAALREIW